MNSKIPAWLNDSWASILFALSATFLQLARLQRIVSVAPKAQRTRAKLLAIISAWRLGEGWVISVKIWNLSTDAL